MPRGDKSSYTGKQKRQAEHIEESEKSKGRSTRDAERIAWATVNKQDGGAKKGGSSNGRSGPGKSTTRKAAAKKSSGRKSSQGPSRKAASKGGRATARKRSRASG